MNDSQPSVEAVGIENDKIIAIGKLDLVKEKLGHGFIQIDLEGKTMLPGFIDSHLHPILFVFYQVNPNVSEITSLDALKAVLKEATQGKPVDKLIIALNLSEEKFDNPILPTKWDLDEACPEHPVFVLRYDGHIGIANSKALALCEIDKNTPTPEGGEIRKDQNGELTGVLSETAISPMFNKIAFPQGKELKEATFKAFNYLASQGLTSLHGILHSDAAGEFGDFGVIEIPLFKSVQSDIPQNWYVMVNTEKPKKLVRLKKPPLDGGKPDSQFRFGCAKFFLDGTFGAKTACMYEPFTDAPERCGFCVEDTEKLYQKIKVAHDNGFQICTHAIGDKGNRIAVDLYIRLLEESPRKDHRLRIEHASILTRDTIEDMAKYGIIASCQPPFINSEFKWLEKRLGKERNDARDPSGTWSRIGGHGRRTAFGHHDGQWQRCRLCDSSDDRPDGGCGGRRDCTSSGRKPIQCGDRPGGTALGCHATRSVCSGASHRHRGARSQGRFSSAGLGSG